MTAGQMTSMRFSGNRRTLVIFGFCFRVDGGLGQGTVAA